MPIRPKSIVQFDWIYLVIIALGIVGIALGWNETMSTVQVQQMVARLGTAWVYVPLALGIAIQLLLWYFIARRGSVVAKWIFVILTAIGVLFSAVKIATGGVASPISNVIEVTLLVLQVIAISLLFRPDVRGWFGETVDAA